MNNVSNHDKRFDDFLKEAKEIITGLDSVSEDVSEDLNSSLEAINATRKELVAHAISLIREEDINEELRRSLNKFIAMYK